MVSDRALHFEHEEGLLQEIWELEQEVKELKAGGREQRIAELEAELEKEREARKLADAAADGKLGLSWAVLEGRVSINDLKLEAVDWAMAGMQHIGKLEEKLAIAFEEKNKKMELEDEVEELKASLNKETEPEPEPKAVANPWGRAGKPGHQRVAPPPAKKARFQPARGAVDAAAAVM